MTDYTKRTAKQFNCWRRLFQIVVCSIGYMIRLKIVYRIKIEGMENIPKTNDYIVCANHLSTLDPPMLVGIFPRGVAFMAKKELFNIRFLRWWLDWLGAFAVNREKLGPSSIKTVCEIRKSNWVFGIFPQGTRQEPGEISNVTSGFAGLAKITKCNILPVGITGTHVALKMPFSGQVTVRIGKPIPYSDDIADVVDKWGHAVEELTGFKYIGCAQE
jgi:1-acyl-sn-glycerol-3-phosphate acyltransferase